MAGENPRTRTGERGDAVSDTPRTDAATKTYIWNGVKHIFVEADVVRQLERELAAVTAERDVLRADLCAFAVDMEKQLSAVTADLKFRRELGALQQQEYDKVTAERDALKAKLATINHVAMSLFVRSTGSEVTGEMAEIGRLSREDGQ